MKHSIAIGILALVPFQGAFVPAHAQDLLAAVSGGGPGGQFGKSVADAGDVDGDGRGDVIVGAPSVPNPSGVSTGAAFVYSGTGVLLRSFYGDSNGDDFGFAVAGLGDVNSDGRSDLAIGAPWDSTGSFTSNGTVFVYSGANGALLWSRSFSASSVRMGHSVAAAGDVNGDGRPDVIVGSNDGSYLGRGTARVFSGADGTELHAWIGTAAYDDFGASVAGAGDVNGDGRPDLIVGAPFEGSYGTARVFSGATGFLLYTFYGEVAGYIEAVGGGGDVNGDGRADLIIGAPAGTVGGWITGVAHAYSGLNGAWLYTLSGSALGDEFGSSVCGIADIDGDGRSDWIVGAPGGGYARAYSGTNGSQLFNLTIYPGAPFTATFGAAVSRAGDVNGDGRADLIVGAPYITQTIPPAAYIYGGPTFLYFCAGDGSATACPCGNAGSARSGCGNSVVSTGAGLCVGGNASVSADTVSITAFGMPLSTSLFFQGTARTNNGAGAVFGDGLRCAGGSTVRLGTKVNFEGAASCLIAGSGAIATYPESGDPPISVRGGVPALGGTRHYQVWYRNAAAFCTSAAFNLTNAVTVLWRF